HAALGAGPEQLLVRLVRRAPEDEVPGALGHERDVAEARGPEHLAAIAVQREDRALVAVAPQVVERDEAELARMARDARDDHPARVEERAQALEGLGVPALGREGGGGLGRPTPHPGG